MKNFRDVLDEGGLMDLGFVGSKFTWFKKLANGDVVWERLDRAVGTVDWLDKYPATKVRILDCGSSDHKALLIDSGGMSRRPNKPWQFEQMWLEDEGCHDTVALAWGEGEGVSPVSRVVGKVEKCQEKLKWWSKRCFSNITWETAEIKRKMGEVEVAALRGSEAAISELVRLKNELGELLVKEEKMW